MRVIASLLATSVLASCATTSGEGRGDHDMAVLAEGTLFVAGAVGASYGCARDWNECRGDLPVIGAVSAGTLALLLGLSYAVGKYEHHMDETVNVHVQATPRAGDVAFAFAISDRAGDPAIGDKDWLGAVLIDPATHGADLSAARRDRVCVAYAPTVEAPIDEVHCAPARPLLLFATPRATSSPAPATDAPPAR